MQHYPIFRRLAGETVVVAGAGEVAVAKLRLLMKTEARLVVVGPQPVPQVMLWALEERLELHERPLEAGDVTGAALLYAANDEPAEDARVAALGRAAGVLVNIVDNLEDSDFITPAIVDRDPVVVAIGTEGIAPVLARRIKARVEEMLPQRLGDLARIAKGFRPLAERLSSVRRRELWARFYGAHTGAASPDPQAVEADFRALLDDVRRARRQIGSVAFVGAGPGDPELLTMKARRLLDEADVVITDRLVGPGVLELARREAEIVEVGKTGFGPSWKQDDINALIVERAQAGHRVVRLKGGDPAIFARLDEEVDAVAAAGVDWQVVPGITAASAAAATVGTGLTCRGRNHSLRLMTGHDTEGHAEHEWRELAQGQTAAAVYMGKRAASFIRGRLMMHGARPDMPVTVVENASLPGERVIGTRLIDLPDTLAAEGVEGPAVLLVGIPQREAARAAAREAV